MSRGAISLGGMRGGRRGRLALWNIPQSDVTLDS